MSRNDGQGSRTAAEPAGTDKSKISVIEKSVTHLLVATKTLLETLTKWSRHAASETEVSDVYVRLGYEFNIACRAFKSVGVETSDLGPVPDLLRGILEETLSGEPSQAHLDKYLPQIRDIIVNLLQGLKKKQQKLRQRHAKERDMSGQSAALSSSEARQSSTSSTFSTGSGDGSNGRQSGRYGDSGAQPVELPDSSRAISTSSAAGRPNIPQRTSSGRGTQEEISKRAGTIVLDDPPQLPTYNIQEAPMISPPSYPQESVAAPSNQQTLAPPVTDYDTPRPRQGDALARLQRGGELERRASRRFSAYQIQKHLGTTTGGMPMMPPAQHSPVPNRGRDLHESMNAVRSRRSQSSGASKKVKTIDTSPNRQNERQHTMTATPDTPDFDRPAVPLPSERSPERNFAPRLSKDDVATSATTDKPALGDGNARPQWSTDLADRSESPVKEPEKTRDPSQSDQDSSTQSVRKYPHITPESTPDPSSQSPQSSKELILFLQYKTQIKKFVLVDGYEELSIARLQLAFIEKFAWNTHSNGQDLPEIYVQDPVSGVRHELEDMNDVKNRSVLVLNVDAVDEVKKHMDDGLGGLRSLLQEVRTAITDQSSAVKRVADKQQEAASQLTRLASAPPPPQISLPGRTSSQTLPNGVPRRTSVTNVSEIQSLRRDLAIMRQTHTSWVTEMESVIATVRSKAEGVKTIASQPAFTDPGDSTTGRAYVNEGRKKLSSTSESIMSRVEELQDTVEDLRKDVVTRGVRPLPRQLETVSRELASATNELKKMQEFIKREKPTWTKIWKNELQVVCEDQNLLTYQEELVVDLDEDLKAAFSTFELIEEATKQQNLVAQTSSGGSGANSGVGASGQGGLRNTSRTMVRDPSADPIKAKDSVLGEVKALQPNHESRLEAIERAERLRQKELEERRDGAFKKELSGFVDEGRLKKSGGFEEAERVRKVKDERMRRLVWDSNPASGRSSPGVKNGDGTEAAAVSDMADDKNSSAESDNVRGIETPVSAETPGMDLSTLSGSAYPFSGTDLSGSEKVETAIAESATVPKPLDVPDVNGHGYGYGRAGGSEDIATTPEAEFVDAMG